MKKYIIKGGNKLSGTLTIAGSKNVISKAIVAASLTSEKVVIENVPLISDLDVALEVAQGLGASFKIDDHKLTIQYKEIKNHKIPLDAGAKSRTASMFLGPLLARCGEAIVPNPGGCRLGARPIDRHVEGLEKMGAEIDYVSEDGYFHAKAVSLKGATYKFGKNTHTGTETLILAAVLANGKTVLENAAEEPEVNDLIALLNKMGAKIARPAPRTIEIIGVKKLNGAKHRIMADRNEAVTFAVLGALSGGQVYLKDVPMHDMSIFLEKYTQAGGAWEESNRGIRFYVDNLAATDITTMPHPGFMTDWQGPWAILMTQAEGTSTVHETIYENRFAYVSELRKMGAKLKFFTPNIDDPAEFYNFSFEDEAASDYSKQGLKIYGPVKLHNAVVDIPDLRAGATLVIAALIAKGTSIMYGFEHIERGYESFDARLKSLGAQIVALGEEVQL